MKRMKLTAAVCAAAMMMTSVTGYTTTAAGLHPDIAGTQAILTQSDASAPTLSLEILGEDSVKISWQSPVEINPYGDVYQYDLARDAAFTDIARTNEAYIGSLKLSKLALNEPYYFRVRTRINGVYTDYTKAVIIMPNPSLDTPFPDEQTTQPVTEATTEAPTQPVTEEIRLQTPNLHTEPYVDDSGNVVSNSVKLMWDAVPNASGYQYHFSEDPEFHQFIKTGDTQKTELKLINLAPGTHYYIRICAVCESNGQTIYSDYGVTEVLIPNEAETTTTTEATTTETTTTETTTTETTTTETTTTTAETTTTQTDPVETTTESTATETTTAQTTETTPTETTVPTETTEPSGDKPLPCDVNSDGEINAVDASDLLVALAKMGAGEDSGLNDTQKKAADADNSGDINAGDASVILMYAAYLGAGGTESFWVYGSAQGWILP